MFTHEWKGFWLLDIFVKIHIFLHEEVADKLVNVYVGQGIPPPKKKIKYKNSVYG